MSPLSTNARNLPFILDSLLLFIHPPHTPSQSPNPEGFIQHGMPVFLWALLGTALIQAFILLSPGSLQSISNSSPYSVPASLSIHFKHCSQGELTKMQIWCVTPPRELVQWHCHFHDQAHLPLLRAQDPFEIHTFSVSLASSPAIPPRFLWSSCITFLFLKRVFVFMGPIPWAPSQITLHPSPASAPSSVSWDCLLWHVSRWTFYLLHQTLSSAGTDTVIHFLCVPRTSYSYLLNKLNDFFT